jgi:hypothetical protein
MLLDEQYRQCVCFLCTERVVDGNRIAQGTAFFVGVPFDQGSDKIYLVTARHNLEESRNAGKALYAKLNIKNGGAEYVAIPQDSWLTHSATDVAVVPFRLEETFDISYIPFERLINDSYLEFDGVDVGDELFFPGLFTPYPGSEKAEPIVRFGRVALGLKKISVELNSGSFPTVVEAYLAETKSWGGESGSPVFHCKWPFSNRERIVLNDPRSPRLLGLLHGHFDIERTSHKKEHVVNLNSGIGIVIPTKFITELLMCPELIGRT